GQVCLGTERVYVQRPIFDRFVAALKARCEAVKYGRPSDAGSAKYSVNAAHPRDAARNNKNARCSAAVRHRPITIPSTNRLPPIAAA
ncbi:MAG: hypothetical protein CVU63_16080, partial [Deltaproteobacteria bacterium HGW-Deltaproteobacteria-20]